MVILFHNDLISQQISTSNAAFISPTEWNSGTLSEVQNARLNKLSAQFPSSDIFKVSIGDIAQLSSNEITVNLQGSSYSNIVFKAKTVEYQNPQNYTWYGEVMPEMDPCGLQEGFLMLMAKQGEIFGQLQVEDEIYGIEDIGGRQLLVKYQNLENGISCPGEVIPDGFNGGENQIQERNAGPCDIRVLFVYTAKAIENVPSIPNIAASAIALTNTALNNSGIYTSDFRFVLADVVPCTLSEQNRTMREFLADTRISPQINNLRNNAFADLVVTLVNQSIMSFDTDGMPAGIAYGYENDSSLGFSVCNSSGLNNGYVFSHEVGHLLGAGHERCDTEIPGVNCISMPTDDAHAHTWIRRRCLKKDQRKKTIMFSSGGGDRDVVLHFSSPGIDYAGTPTGIADVSHNAKAIRINACNVADYETDDVVFSASISGPNRVCYFNDIAELSANITGYPGNTNYQYEWKKGLTGVNWDAVPVVGTSPNYNVNSQTYAVGTVIFIRLKVTDVSNNLVAEAFHSVTVFNHHVICERNNSDINPEEFVLAAPNPSTGTANILFKIDDVSEVHIKVIGIDGTILEEKAPKIYEQGSYAEPIGNTIQCSTYAIAVIRIGDRVSRMPIFFIR